MPGCGNIKEKAGEVEVREMGELISNPQHRESMRRVPGTAKVSPQSICSLPLEAAELEAATETQ